MSDLSSFLLARIAEDEEVARAASGSTVTGRPGSWVPISGGDEWEVSTPHNGVETEVLVALRSGLDRPPAVMDGYWGQVAQWHDAEGEDLPVAQHIARHDPTRVLAECAAKRAIIAAAVEADDTAAFPDLDGGRAWGLEEALEMLAVVYADHADYREEWRP